MTVGDSAPAAYIAWEDAMSFCRKLTRQEREAKRLPKDWEYRLPTEAQWEYACRAGTTKTFFFGSVPRDLQDYGWYRRNANGPDGNPTAHNVGLKKSNPWGLYDMLGNVEEWCFDFYGDRRSGGRDPMGPASHDFNQHVLRGGHFFNEAIHCRSAVRSPGDPKEAGANWSYGFRVAIVRSSQARCP